MKTKNLLLSSLGCLGLVAFSAQPAFAQLNNPPPTGNVIYSLTGQAISSSYQTATVTFQASTTSTNLAFAFREDPAFLDLANVSLTTGGGSNLLANGDFSGGTYTVGGSPNQQAEPNGWTYLNIYGATYGGSVNSTCGPSGGTCYYDGAVGAYDGINQVVATTIGTTYTLTFEYADNGPGYGYPGTYQPLSTNGYSGTSGNGRDMFVYAGASIPTAAPEPGTFALFAGALAALGLAALARRRARLDV